MKSALTTKTLALIQTAAAILFSAQALAFENSGELDGVYIVREGSAQSQEIGALTSPDPQDFEQIGTYQVFLTRKNWDELPTLERSRIRKNVFATGAFRGQVAGVTVAADAAFPITLLTHTLGTRDRTGVIITQNDALLPNTIGVQVCDPTRNLVVLTGREQMNPAQGFGAFENLAGGRFLLELTANQCTLQNDIRFIPRLSFICFGNSQACPQ